jgi:hypothetical protein
VSQNLGLKCFLLLLRMNNDGLKVSSIEKFKNGAILMYHAHNCLLYYDPSRKNISILRFVEVNQTLRLLFVFQALVRSRML